jgi:class 3 adenylate cyclase
MRRTERGRGLRAVVFVDTVGSTQIAATLGDKRWQELLRRQLLILRRLLKERGGQEVDTAGDGLFALFKEPAPAVRFAASACEAVRQIGLEIRAGVHFGEVEFADGRPGGIVVHTGARAMGVGAAGEVLVTQTVRELVSGGGLSFAEHGTYSLKGIPGTSVLYQLREIDDAPVAPPLTEDEAAERMRESSQPPALVKRRTFLAAAGVTAVAGGVTTAFVFGGEEPTREKRSPSEPATVAGERLFRYLPEADELTMMPGVYSSTGFLPSVVVGEGAVWTGDFTLHHVDLDDGSEGDPINLQRGDSDFVYGLAIGFNDVWAATAGGLHRIDPGDDEELSFRQLFGGALTIAVGFGSVWVGNVAGRLYRIAPTRELPILRTLSVGDLVSGVVATHDRVWVSDEFGVLVPIDPSRDRVEEPVPIGGSPKGLAATDDRLWVVDPQAKSVTVVDIESRTEVRSIPIEGAPVDVATGLDAVWVADFEGSIVKIDEAQLGVVERHPVGGPVAALAIDEDAGVIWLRTTHP